MVDYAHNPAGFQAIGKYLEKVDASRKVGIIAGVGDRRDEDTIHLGEIAAEMFDEIIIRQDRNLRGRTEDEIINLLTTGIKKINPEKIIHVHQKEKEAIEFAIKNAKKNSFITLGYEAPSVIMGVGFRF